MTESPIHRHHLLILSQHSKVYDQIITRAKLPGLSISTAANPKQAEGSAGDCDILFGEPSLISSVLNQLHKVRWVQATWAGVEALLVAGMRHDYILTNARNVYGLMLSEYVFGYLITIERGILHRWQAQLDGRWENETPGTLRNKHLGLLGVGSIGAHLALSAHLLGMVVFGYTRQSETCDYVDQYLHGDEWRDFASGLDYLVCTLPATPSTKNLINADFLSALPERTWLVNIGRGCTLDETALVNNLRNGSLAGAVLDVTKEEPLPPGHPLWSTPNTFLTFHTAARNHPPDIASIFIDNYQRYIKGKPLKYRVDFTQGY